jgi:hypothetical protein
VRREKVLAISGVAVPGIATDEQRHNHEHNEIQNYRNR